MRPLVALLAVVLLSLSASACGASKNATSVSQTSSTVEAPSNVAPTATTTSSSHEPNNENDNDDHRRLKVPVDDTNNGTIRAYGHAASAADTRAVTSLLKRYYAIALAGEGAKACTMIVPSLVKAIPLDYGQFGAPYLHGAKTCAAVMSRLFKHEHRQLAAEIPHMKLLSLRLGGNQGLVLLGFGRMSERQITVIRPGGTWKLAVLLDGEVE
jgi:hypothetical protein